MKLNKFFLAGCLLLASSFYLWGSSRFSYEYIWNAIFNNDTSTIAVSMSGVEISSGTVSISGVVPVNDNGGVLTVDNNQYEAKVSTYAAGEVYSTSSISVSFDIDQFSCHALDGEATVNINGGENINFSDTVFFSTEFKRLIPSPTLNFTFITATTAQYYMGGVE